MLQFYVGLCYIHVTRSGSMLCRCYMSTSTHLMCNYIPHAQTLPKTRTQWVSRPQVSQTSLSLIVTMVLLYNIPTCTCLHVPVRLYVQADKQFKICVAVETMWISVMAGLTRSIKKLAKCSYIWPCHILFSY